MHKCAYVAILCTVHNHIATCVHYYKTIYIPLFSNLVMSGGAPGGGGGHGGREL